VACFMSLHRHEESEAGRCVLILAYQQQPAGSLNQQQQIAGSLDASEEASETDHSHANKESVHMHPERDKFYKTVLQHARSNPFSNRILEMMLSGHPGPGLGIGAEEVCLVGSCFVDSFGDLVPPRSLDASRDGAMGWYNREGIAYVSNVAVLPEARGQGIAQQLMEEAHLLAQSWGCRAVGLHCNQKNSPAVRLYERLGYRRTVLEPAIMPFLNGRGPDRCHFFFKSVTKKFAVVESPHSNVVL